MTNYRIIISHKAYSNITECVLFVKNVSVEAARELYDEIMTSINSLTSFPNKYPEVDGLLIRQSKIRKMVIHNGRYIILYKVDNEIVFIYDILDSRKDNYFCLK